MITIALWLLAWPVFQVDDTKTMTEELDPAPAVAAAAVAGTVDGHPITLARVDRHLKKTLGDRTLDSQIKRRARQAALEHLIDRHLVLLSIGSQGYKAGESEIRLEVSKLEDRLAEVNQNLAQHLEETGSTKAELEYELRWKIAWGKYLRKYLTDERLGKYFARNRRKFDGTRVRVAHLLLRDDSEPDTSASMKNKANEIRDTVLADSQTWSEAVREHSIASSASGNAGEIGWVTVDGPMSLEFCAAAIELDEGDISEPVRTPFGIHLIKCLKVERGSVRPSDVKEKIRAHATRFLFESQASGQRPKASIEYDAVTPGN